MSVKIRLTKTGKKHQISFRVVVQDSRSPRDGKCLEILGFYNPHKKPPESIYINQERLKLWLSKGAKPTEGVGKLLNQIGKAEKSKKLT